MIRGGLSSVSYRNSSADLIIESARSAGLGGIEWSADTHAPHGDLKQAEKLMIATLRAGLTISAYGSFFRLQARGNDGLFSEVLETARRLQAPTIRIYAGARDAEDRAPAQSRIEEAKSIADTSGRHGITVCLEPLDRSEIADYEILQELIERVAHPFFKACWTQIPSSEYETRLEAASNLAPHLALVHLRNWTTGYARKPLDPQEACWSAIGGMAEYGKSSVLDRWAIIEYLEDESPETLTREAKALAERLKA